MSILFQIGSNGFGGILVKCAAHEMLAEQVNFVLNRQQWFWWYIG